MKRFLFAGLVLLVGAGCVGGGGQWTCNWQCVSNETMGSHTYPNGPDPTDQCGTDYSNGCQYQYFHCSCTQ